MKAIVLSAGQGRRLLPLTAEAPKCTLRLHGRALIDWQLDQLGSCGIDQAVVVVGFGADHVDRVLAARSGGPRVRTHFNPFFEVADNLASCWMASQEMTEDFVLVNGDTLFESSVLRHLLEAQVSPVTLAIDRKAHYDDDDMKVQLSGERLLRVGKDLPADQVDGESIGLMLFRGEGPALFREALDRAMRRPEALGQWYLSVIGQLARDGRVGTRSIAGLDWVEVDYSLDVIRAAKLVGGWVGDESEGLPHVPESLQAGLTG